MEPTGLESIEIEPGLELIEMDASELLFKEMVPERETIGMETPCFCSALMELLGLGLVWMELLGLELIISKLEGLELLWMEFFKDSLFLVVLSTFSGFIPT